MPCAPSAVNHTERAERSVLGAILEGRLAMEDARLHAQDFADAGYQRVFLRCEQIAAMGKTPDAITLCDTYPDLDPMELTNIVGMAQLDASLLMQHVENVREASCRRKLGALCSSIMALTQDYAKPLDKTIETLRRVTDQLAVASGKTEGLTGTDAIVELDAYLSSETPETLIPTGVKPLSQMLGGGLQGGRLYVVGARPGMGKSALLSQIALSALSSGLRVLYVSLEMGGREVIMRMTACLSRVPCSRLQSRTLSEDDFLAITEAYGTLRPDNLFLISSATSPSAIRIEALRLRANGGIGLVVVDYLQLMSPDVPTANRAEAVGGISRALKQLAMELGCPVLAASQVNRGSTYGEDRAPRLSELRESGSIEQDADAVVLLHAPLSAQGSPIKPVQMHLAKNRQGSTGEIPALFDAPRMRFAPAAQAAPPPS